MKTVIFRGVLYFLIACLPILGERFAQFAAGAPPSGWQLAVVITNSVLAGCIALRAYVDGSYQRHIDSQDNP